VGGGGCVGAARCAAGGGRVGSGARPAFRGGRAVSARAQHRRPAGRRAGGAELSRVRLSRACTRAVPPGLWVSGRRSAVPAARPRAARGDVSQGRDAGTRGRDARPASPCAGVSSGQATHLPRRRNESPPERASRRAASRSRRATLRGSEPHRRRTRLGLPRTRVVAYRPTTRRGSRILACAVNAGTHLPPLWRQPRLSLAVPPVAASNNSVPSCRAIPARPSSRPAAAWWRCVQNGGPPGAHASLERATPRPIWNLCSSTTVERGNRYARRPCGSKCGT
jgi:hypothetical protein